MAIGPPKGQVHVFGQPFAAKLRFPPKNGPVPDRRPNAIVGKARSLYAEAMRACVQRVRRAAVTVAGQVCGSIGQGMLVLLGVGHADTEADAQWLAKKIAGLRIFEDTEGKMNLSLADVGGGMLVVSQFTLLGDCRRGRRPDFTAAAPPELAERLYEVFVHAAAQQGVHVATGRFRQHMEVELVNDGPVTVVVASGQWE
jgi:D-aminoacyl-tRNA deacylase